MAPSVHEILGALQLPHCSVFKGSAVIRTTPNSRVLSLPVVDLHLLLAAYRLATASYDGVQPAVQLGINAILVTSPRPPSEHLHYHTSCVIGMVTSGAGQLDYEQEGKERSATISPGDMFVIPQKALHTLCALTDRHRFDCVTFEFGEELDYQRHYYAESPQPPSDT